MTWWILIQLYFSALLIGVMAYLTVISLATRRAVRSSGIKIPSAWLFILIGNILVVLLTFASLIIFNDF